MTEPVRFINVGFHQYSLSFFLFTYNNNRYIIPDEKGFNKTKTMVFIVNIHYRNCSKNNSFTN
jgi:hypothetical protein